MAELHHAQQGQAFADEHHHHRVLAAEAIRQKAAKGSRESVGQVVDGQRHREQGQDGAEQVDRHLGQAVVLGDRAELSGGHQAAGGHRHEQRVGEPEHRGLDHLRGGVVDLGRHMARRCDDPLGQSRLDHHHRDQEDARALQDAEEQERVLVAQALDHAGDRNDGHRGAGAESGRRQACGEPAPVREPLERVADASAVDATGSEPGDGGGEVQQRQGIRIGVEDPPCAGQHGAGGDDGTGAEPVDQPALDRHQPRLDDDEDRERQLDRRQSPVILRLDRIDEQRPTVLQVGDEAHADDAEDELSPAKGRVLCDVVDGATPLCAGLVTDHGSGSLGFGWGAAGWLHWRNGRPRE